MTAGPGCDPTGALGPKLRLFFSAVKPWATQLGAAVPPKLIRTLVASEALLLKVAVPPTLLLSPPSPKMLNSAMLQPDDAFTELSPLRENAEPPTVTVMLSDPTPAVPESRRSVAYYGAMAITALLGAAFLYLEAREFAGLVARGAGPTRSAFLSAFFTLVGCHGIHVTAGLQWL